MQDLKNKLEAILFIVSKALSLQEISKFAGVGSIGVVKEALESLQEDYLDRNSALELKCEFDKWGLNVKKEFLYLTDGLLTDAELTKPVQETLAIIAHKQPAIQSDVIKVRGVSAYEHIRILLEEEFITSEKSGRTRMLKITSKFYDYFNVVDTELVKNFNQIKEEPKNEV